jgi:hypothetical protein
MNQAFILSLKHHERRFVMGLFKKNVIKEIDGDAWGHLLYVHKLDVNTLSRDIRCVEREGVLDGKLPVTFLRVFKIKEAEQRGVKVTGWETFDQHPDLILFEGYITKNNKASLERKRT